MFERCLSFIEGKEFVDSSSKLSNCIDRRIMNILWWVYGFTELKKIKLILI